EDDKGGWLGGGVLPVGRIEDGRQEDLADRADAVIADQREDQRAEDARGNDRRDGHQIEHQPARLWPFLKPELHASPPPRWSSPARYRGCRPSGGRSPRPTPHRRSACR